MKYMVLMNATPAGFQQFGAMPAEDVRAHIQFMKDLNKELADSGELVFAEGLTPPNQAKLVQARDGGRPPITDGPFAESKEFLAGFWIVQVKSEQRALELAARISAAPGRGGVAMNFPVELRPIGAPPEV